MSKILKDGYVLGQSYSYYRAHGHGPVSAAWCATPLWGCMLIGVGLGIAPFAIDWLLK